MPTDAEKPCVAIDAGQVVAHVPVLEEDRAAGVPAFNLPHDGVDIDVVPVVEHADRDLVGRCVGTRTSLADQRVQP